MYYKSFSFCLPLFTPMDFSIEHNGENLSTEQSVLIDTKLKAHKTIMAQFSRKVTQERARVPLHYEHENG